LVAIFRRCSKQTGVLMSCHDAIKTLGSNEFSIFAIAIDKEPEQAALRHPNRNHVIGLSPHFSLRTQTFNKELSM